MTENRGSVADHRQVGRFTLTDLVDERYGCQIWRGVDSTLAREVAIWVIPTSDPDMGADLEAATRTAASVADRRIVRILDVFPIDEHVVIVTEWTNAEVLRDHLHQPLPPAEAARVAYEVAGAIESAHAAGIVHGRLRPSNVLIAQDGEVRITGLGIDAMLAGLEPAADGDPVAADLHGIGSILYACLTARWPDGSVDGIPASPEVGGHIPPPSRLLADIPESLDDVCARTVRTLVPPRGRPKLGSAGQARELLGASLTDLTGQRRPLSARLKSVSATTVRVASGVAIGLVLFVMGWVGLRLLGTDAEAGQAQPSPSPTAEPSQEASEPPKAVTYQIASARDFDPLGNGEENPGRVPFAYDGDKNTAWRTVTYYNKSLDKPGVGVLVDLGAPRAIGKVVLDMVGNGSDLQLLTSNEEGDRPQDYTLVAQATEAGEKVTLKAPRPQSARYVLIWMTGLPQVDGGWRGGIREMRITS